MGIKTASDFLDEKSTISDPPAEPEKREASPEPGAAASTEPKPSEKPAEVKPEPQVVASPDKDDEEPDHEPDNLEGYKKALAAARGDKRKARKKWQEAERRLAEFEGFRRGAAQFAPKPEASTQAPKEPILDDTNFFDPKAVEARIQHLVNAGVSSVQQVWFQRNVATARERHEDFEEFETEFKKAVAANPSLGTQADAAPDPAEFAYRTGKALREMQGVGTIDEFRAKIAAEERAKIEAEFAAKNGAAPQPASNSEAPARTQTPKSIANMRGTGVGATPEYKPITSLNALFPG